MNSFITSILIAISMSCVITMTFGVSSLRKRLTLFSSRSFIYLMSIAICIMIVGAFDLYSSQAERIGNLMYLPFLIFIPMIIFFLYIPRWMESWMILNINDDDFSEVLKKSLNDAGLDYEKDMTYISLKETGLKLRVASAPFNMAGLTFKFKKEYESTLETLKNELKKNLAGVKGVSSTPVALIYALLPAVLLITLSVISAFPVLEGMTFSEAMSVSIHLREGSEFMNEGKYEEALEALDKALEVNPEYVEVLSAKGGLLMELGRYEEAVSVYDKATQVEPENAMLWNKKGKVLIELERYEEAVTAFDKALEIYPEFKLALDNKEEALVHI